MFVAEAYSPWTSLWAAILVLCFCSHFPAECEYLLSFCLNLSDFSVNFWLLLLSFTINLKSPFHTCCSLSAFGLFQSSFCQLMQSQCLSLADQLCLSFFPGYGLWLSAASIRISVSALIAASPSATVDHSSQCICTAAILSEAPVEFLCCCYLEKTFFQNCSICLTSVPCPWMR